MVANFAAGRMGHGTAEVRYTDCQMMDRAQIEKISKALGDETRLMIFEAIARKKQMNCGEIVSLQGVTPATVSHHLKVLSDAGLIACRRQGQFVLNKVVPGTMEEYTRSLTRLVGGKTTVKPRSGNY
ncbi:MAG: metalloregulator ArsR/SmtB family transcription factor [Terriglobales bacterium]